MRNNKHNIVLTLENIFFNARNITLGLGNIILFLKNIIGHFTGKAKIITLRFKNIMLSRRIIILCSIILILSSINITLCSSNILFGSSNVSALSYQSSVGVGFTFNPTLSVSLSSSDLVISNLTPGSSADSNIINVSVATNASYGYTLSATVGDNTHDNSNLTHSNNTNVFSSIAIDADLPSLTTDNTWGYNISLDSGSTWFNYNGLSSSSSTTLLDKDSNISSSIDFRIGAKASPVQPSGTYTNTITFTAVTKPTPMNLSESYFAHGKTRHSGYYAMQDMTTEICNDTEVIGEGSQTELIDIRDNKVYWAAKLADNHCWMTQNLDLVLSPDRPLTSEDTDLNDNSLAGAYAENYTYDPETKIITWVPKNTTNTWGNSYNTAYSIDPGDWYWDGNYETPTCDYLITACEDFSRTPYDGIGAHGHVGNYYNWSAAIASDNSSSLNYSTYDDVSNNPQNSICPKNWRLPTISGQAYNIQNSTNEFLRLRLLYNNNSSRNDSGLIIAPVYFARFGRTGNYSSNLVNPGSSNFYYSSTIYGDARAYGFYNMHSSAGQDQNLRSYGTPLRCLVK